MGEHLPQEITHPLHLQHQLQLDQHWDFVCDKCSYISTGFRYFCTSCYFTLDLACASLVNDLKTEEEWHYLREGKKKTTHHYIHNHQLTLFKYKKIVENDYDCSWCGKRLLHMDVCYGCFGRRGCNFYLHEVCLDKISRTLIHPFHSLHFLRLFYAPDTTYCFACQEDISLRTPYSRSYWCEKCDFRIDFRCASLLPTLKHKCHPHLLTYFGNTSKKLFDCSVCHKNISYCNFYRCVQCDFNVHLQCISTPSTRHKYHRHLLVLLNSVEEDDSGEYYCDVCEKERNPKHPVYYCEKCNYIAHIECILHEDIISPSALPSTSMDSKTKEGTNEILTPRKEKYQQLVHEHPMEVYEVTENLNESRYCNACRQVLSGPTHICTVCEYYLHKRCANLPFELQHPSHSTHPLYLYAANYLWIGYKVCDECRDICLGFIYVCEECHFKLDLKCTFTDGAGVSQLKEEDRVIELHHFNHHHKLILANSSDPIDEIECEICRVPILGPAYFCSDLDCNYIIHESCLEIPQKMQVPFHMEHTSVFRRNLLGSNEKQCCYACSLEIGHYNCGYSCEEGCGVKLHYICAHSLRRPLKYESHGHNLYYFGTNWQLVFVKKTQLLFHCHECLDICKGQPFYRCLDCHTNFHLECVHIPRIVKSKCHIHPLILKDSFVEDDSEEYYCDVCEKERNGNDHVYYCEECKGLFLAHIECALAKVEEVVSYLDAH
ncbi:hypothetical protein DITRI_Ditri20bG0038100 [Diplodiscus trichospermus]